MRLNAGDLDQRINFQRKNAAKDPVYGTPVAGWVDAIVGVAAQVQDMLPSRGERIADGIAMANRPTRIRIRHRAGITADMRVIWRDRTMQIVAGPAMLGHREAIELVCEDYSTAGDVA